MAVKPLQSVANAVAVVEAVARSQPIGVADLARRLDMTKSSTQRMLVSLRAAGWLRTVDDDQDRTRWELAPRLVEIGERARPARTVLEQVRPILRRLRGQLAESTHLAVADGSDVVVVETVVGPGPLHVTVPVGARAPRDASAAGRAIAAARDVAVGDGPPAFTVNEERVEAGYHAVAVGLPPASAEGALVVAGPASRLVGRRLQEAGDALVASVRPLWDEAASHRP